MLQPLEARNDSAEQKTDELLLWGYAIDTHSTEGPFAPEIRHWKSGEKTQTVKIQTEFYLRVALAIVHLMGWLPVENSKQNPQKFNGFTAHNSDLFTHTEDETKVTCLSYFVGCKWLGWSSCMLVSSLT